MGNGNREIGSGNTKSLIAYFPAPSPQLLGWLSIKCAQAAQIRWQNVWVFTHSYRAFTQWHVCLVAYSYTAIHRLRGLYAGQSTRFLPSAKEINHQLYPLSTPTTITTIYI